MSKTITEIKAELKAALTKENVKKSKVDTGLSAEEFQAIQANTKIVLESPNKALQLTADASQTNPVTTEQADVFHSFSPSSLGEEENAERKSAESATSATEEAAESKNKSELFSERRRTKLQSFRVEDSENPLATPIATSFAQQNAPLFSEKDNDANVARTLSEGFRIFSRHASRTHASMDATTKAQFISQLTAVNEHYSNPKNQIAEKFGNFWRGKKKTTDGQKSRAPFKARAATDLISLINENNLTSERILNVFCVNKITAIAFCEGKTAKLLSSEFITLLKSSAPTIAFS